MASANDMLRKVLHDRLRIERYFAAVGPIEDHFNAFLQNAGFLQQRGQRCTGPLGRADAAVKEGQAMIARTFQGKDDILLGRASMSAKLKLSGFSTMPSTANRHCSTSISGQL
ncbi:MAG: hypothetical protein R2867_23400 [Caldilineaceae bacterium]